MRVSVSPHVLVRQVEGELVLLNLKTKRYFGLDEVGTRVWALLATGQQIQAVYEALLAEYDVDAERLRQNLDELIGKLAESGLIEIYDG